MAYRAGLNSPSQLVWKVPTNPAISQRCRPASVFFRYKSLLTKTNFALNSGVEGPKPIKEAAIFLISRSARCITFRSRPEYLESCRRSRCPGIAAEVPSEPTCPVVHDLPSTSLVSGDHRSKLISLVISEFLSAFFWLLKYPHCPFPPNRHSYPRQLGCGIGSPPLNYPPPSNVTPWDRNYATVKPILPEVLIRPSGVLCVATLEPYYQCLPKNSFNRRVCEVYLMPIPKRPTRWRHKVFHTGVTCA